MNLEEFTPSDTNENAEGEIQMYLKDFLFESVLHCIEAWYYAFARGIERDIEDDNIPCDEYWIKTYNIYNSNLELGNIVIKFRRIGVDGDNVINVMSFAYQETVLDPAHAAQTIVRAIGTYLRKWREESEKEALETEDSQFNVTTKPCKEMWNNTSFCIERTGEGVCVFCNSKME